MPELPEVETIRRGLQKHLVGDTIEKIVLRRNDIICGDADDFVASVTGRRVAGTGRRGKVLWLELDAGTAIGVHLRMSGRLLLVPGMAQVPKHTHLVAELSSGRQLLYADTRRFGRLELLRLHRLDEAVLLRNIGPDALSDELTSEWLLEAAACHGIGIKAFLLDQSHIAGIGNIYACEILHRAGLHPATPARRVTPEEMSRLRNVTREVLEEAIDAGGTTLADGGYENALGEWGAYRQMLGVYGREGEQCQTEGCCGKIVRLKMAGRGTYLCPVCQAKGKRRAARRR